VRWLERLAALARIPREKPEALRTWSSGLAAGVRVTEDTALQFAAVWSATRVIAETVAALPWRVYEKQGAARRLRDTHPVDWVLNAQPNTEMGAFTWRETMLAHVLLWGNAYAEIEFDLAERVLALWPIAPDRVEPKRNADGELVYEVRQVSGGLTVLPASRVFHLRGLGWDGRMGYSVVRLAAESIGAGIAQDRFAAAFFGNGAHVGGVIEQAVGTKNLTPEARKVLLDDFNRKHRGAGNAFRVEYLDGGMSFKPLNMPLTDAQFLESRRFSVQDVARWFRVPPHKLADLERATFSNIEHQSIEFVSDTIVPWCCRLEQEANAKLLGRNERAAGRYTKVNLGGLLRGDLDSRYRAYATARQWGWLSANDIRELEELNPIGEGGDDYLVPMNMRPSDEPMPEPAAPAMRRPSTQPEESEDAD